MGGTLAVSRGAQLRKQKCPRFRGGHFETIFNDTIVAYLAVIVRPLVKPSARPLAGTGGKRLIARQVEVVHGHRLRRDHAKQSAKATAGRTKRNAVFPSRAEEFLSVSARPVSNCAAGTDERHVIRDLAPEVGAQ